MRRGGFEIYGSIEEPNEPAKPVKRTSICHVSTYSKVSNDSLSGQRRP